MSGGYAAGVATASRRRIARGRSSARRCRTSLCRRRRRRVDRGIDALQGTRRCCRRHGIGRVAQLPPAIRPSRPQPRRCVDVAPRRQPIKRSPASRGLRGGRFRAGGVFSRGVVRESNPQQPDSWSGALPSELTTVVRRSLRQNPFTERTRPTAITDGPRAPLARLHQPCFNLR